jgi:hypothetical protein
MIPVRPHTLVAAVSLLLLSTMTAVAQQRADPLSTGEGKSSIATSRGLSALYGNIGGLAMDRMGRRDGEEGIQLDIAVLPLGIAAGSTYLSPDDLNFVFGTKDCDVFTDDDRIRISEMVEGEKLSADAAFDLLAVRLRFPGIGAVGVRFGHHVRARMTFPESFRTTVLGTEDLFGADHDFSGADVGGEWLRELHMTFATGWERPGVSDSVPNESWFHALGVGVDVSRLDGIAHFDVDPSSTVTTTRLPRETGTSGRSLVIHGNYTFRTSAPKKFEPARAIVRPGFIDADTASGAGWGGSIGLSGVVLRTVRHIIDYDRSDPLNPQVVRRDEMIARDAITFGVSIDEIGSVLWDGFNLSRTREFDSVWTDNGSGVTYAALCNFSGALDTIGAFRTSLPTTLRVGGAVDITAFVPDLGGDLIASFEGAFPLNNAIGNERNPRLSIGGSWTLFEWLTIRSGLQIGGRVGSALSLGAGIRPFRWLSIEAATSELTSVVAADPDRYDLAFRVAGHLGF